MLVVGIGLAQDTVWTRRFDGGRDERYGFGGVDPQGGAVVAGNTRHPINGNIVIELARFTDSGEFVWSRIYDTTGSNYICRVAVDASGNAVVVGTDLTVAPVLKYDRDGNLAWVKQLTPDTTGYYAWLCGVVTDDSGNIYAGGGFMPTTTQGALFLTKLSAAGDSVWACTHNLSSDEDGEGIQTLATAPDGMIVGAGRIGDYWLESYDLLTVKFAPDGETAWTRRLDFKFEDQSAGMAVDSQGNIYVTGYCGRWPQLPDTCFTVKCSPDGDTVWTRRYGEARDARGQDIDIGPDGNALVCAYTIDTLDRLAVVLICYTPKGDTAWTRHYRPDTSDWCGALQFEGPDAFYAFGACTDDPAQQDCSLLLMKLSYGADIHEPSPPPTPRRQQAPSIIREVLRVGDSRPDIGQGLVLLDIAGRKVMDLQPGNNDIRQVAPGVYFVRSAESGRRSAIRKVIIQR
jgi:hypothetical protein